MEELNKAQRDLEEDIVKMGVDRYRAMTTKRAAADLPPGMRLVRRAVEPLADRIQRDKERVLAGTPLKSSTVFYFLDQFEPDMLAYVTARTIISSFHRFPALTSLAKEIGRTLENAVNYDRLKEEHPGIYRVLLKRLAKSPHEGHRHLVFKRYLKNFEIKTVKWGASETTKVGTYLIDCFIEETGFAYLKAMGQGKGSDRPYFVCPEPSVAEWLQEAHGRCELLHPFHMPMIAKPLEWSTPYNGGYYTEALKYPLIKTANKNYLQELEWVEMPMVYKAINALQNTPWKINRPVLRVIEECWQAGMRVGKLPSSNFLETPAKAHDPDKDQEAHKGWRREAAKVHDFNYRTTSKRVIAAQRIAIARKFHDTDRFYFPHSLDTRGRAYPVSSVLTPQGDDVSKALLTFADAKPLGTNGQYWLYMHGANCFGVDKVAFDDRITWVQEHHEHILDSALNPLDGSRFWTEADDPFQFLAFSFVYLGLELHLKAGGRPEEYQSDLPVSLDGSCNGLQNFSAMLLDEVGGKATNLVPSAVPSDLYGEVAKVTNELVKQDAENGILLGMKWEGNVTRQLVKRNTMTVPYAVTLNGMKKQLMKEFSDAADGEASENDWDDASYLAEHNHEAIGRVVVAARRAMEWLRKSAQVAASNGLPVQWVTPAGLQVLQYYKKMKGVRTRMTINGRELKLTLRFETEVLDTRKQSLGIAPNFVHSLDAAHMQRTVCHCADEGVEHFSMIHDSFGTHAGSVDILSYQLRRAFVEQYSGDVLADFKAQLETQLPEKAAKKLPELPPKGNLDLSQVMDSLYFFA
ncbi:hypothetical protein NB640_12270 [Oxalobacter vibrioformis]|uniref:DNA-directed RNA polymerase n=1 Tax=Oxalobacter vibrioformis TaxID=933080 RepID=A0A9E9P4D4_9BURK|nr:DNA-directed RNA polymerase [Oxalobacter vibrioformis]WAW09976.1 hypothetical protein NB640_12270 [Oxalobacter vibrioformis]